MDKAFSMPKEFKNLVESFLGIAEIDLDSAIEKCEADCEGCKELLRLLEDYKKETKEEDA